jgi:hypothetical protein
VDMLPRHVGGRYPTPGLFGEGLSALSCLTLHTDHLAKSVDHIHQIALCFHHGIDVIRQYPKVVANLGFTDDSEVDGDKPVYRELSWQSEFASMRDLSCSRQRTTKIHFAEIGWWPVEFRYFPCQPSGAACTR